jgi:hypothetical protein
VFERNFDYTQDMKIIDEAGCKPRRVQLFRTNDGRANVYGVAIVRPDGSIITSWAIGTLAHAETEFIRLASESQWPL